ncbi:hypothetical protein GCM10012275_33800 [Longimycelium tulufanense]|uniref:Uncharacterized protein n=1 Tax=Longimycelium tulufanense TaxID=907463 RepID=A0A8J3C9E9_9PSEU|nr:hypothetical protein [Longimycelium tulufanense]GGM59921.1 hypothetical protein GCM10012275_33800 [Longimycelium tulufanense]
MPNWDDWHRVEFFRVLRGRRLLWYTQRINDHGFYLWRRRNHDPVAEYTKAVADEWFEREGRPAGERWAIRVSRLDDGQSATPLCEIEITTCGDGRPATRLVRCLRMSRSSR